MRFLIIAVPLPEDHIDFAQTILHILNSKLDPADFLEETETTCPNCGNVLQHDDSGDSPPVWCSDCGLGWPRVYPSQPVSPFMYIRSGNGNPHA